MNGDVDSEWSRVQRDSPGVNFCEVVTVFLFDQNRYERCEIDTKKFDGRCEDLLPPVSRNRARCYAQHWDDLSALTGGARSLQFDDQDNALWLMEHLPCDADL